MSEQNAQRMAWIAAYKRNIVDSETVERKFLAMIKDEVDMIREWHELKRNRDLSKSQMVKKVESLRTVYYEIIDRLHKETLTIEQQSFQQYLETFESKLTAFKLSMRDEFDVLEEQEMQTMEELAKINESIEDWVNQHDNIRIKESQAYAEQKRKNEERKAKDLERKATIGAMDRKIASIGRTGTWDPRDHDSFLRVWNQMIDPNEVQERFAKNTDPENNDVLLTNHERNALIKKLVMTVPIKKTVDLEEHITWYLQYLSITLAKKKAIQEWKAELLHEKSKNHEEALITEILDEKESINDINIDNHENGIDVDDANNHKESNINERLAAKQRIIKWKADRQKQLENERLEKMKQHIKDKEARDEEKRKRNLVIRSQLDRWKKSEDDNARLASQLKAEQVRPKTADPRVMLERQQRDLEHAKNKKANMDYARNKPFEREQIIRDTKVNVLEKEVTRDTNRLLSDTKATTAGKVTYEDLDAANHRRTSGGAHSSTIAMSGRDLQFGGRATPAWMKPH